ncbi:LysR family transcriptional regulator [Nonomuraea dietziae]|uniref:DNA-binding transcriptional LysR family regulator n=1 Tax=Nonomuraea dietziae TaxID=65515 RepID=A0A7W5VDR5_9ACTN|nr:LysR family transcriptional regulator [Nonomuraea dietziae]MBB3731780.1 DNA-binding transcriptional LysR family regulator [Nonomuraea dietziae]
MELRRLRYFRAVAEEANLTRAAEWLGIRATSLSSQIIALERELGAALFRRTPAGMELTAAGRALFAHATGVLEAAESAERAVRDAADDERALRIGVTPGSPPWAVRALWRGANVEARDLSVARQLTSLRAGELDGGLLVLPADTSGLGSALVSEARLGVLVSRDHPLAARPRASWADLDGQELLWFDRRLAPGYHEAVLSACRQAGWRPVRVREGAARHGLLAAELSHGGALVALRPRWDMREGDGLTWLPLCGGPSVRHALVWDPAREHAGRLHDLAAHLAREAPPHGHEETPRGRG